MWKGRSPLGLLVLLVAMAGCRKQSPPDGAKPSSSLENAPTDAWLGRWDGVEGTYLQLARNGGRYAVEIRDLDGSKTFVGAADGNRIRFTRDGKTEFLSAGDGQATGMKWLADKKNCLLTRSGEGWCRS